MALNKLLHLIHYIQLAAQQLCHEKMGKSAYFCKVF